MAKVPTMDVVDSIVMLITSIPAVLYHHSSRAMGGGQSVPRGAPDVRQAAGPGASYERFVGSVRVPVGKGHWGNTEKRWPWPRNATWSPDQGKDWPTAQPLICPDAWCI